MLKAREMLGGTQADTCCVYSIFHTVTQYFRLCNSKLNTYLRLSALPTRAPYGNQTNTVIPWNYITTATRRRDKIPTN